MSDAPPVLSEEICLELIAKARRSTYSERREDAAVEAHALRVAHLLEEVIEADRLGLVAVVQTAARPAIEAACYGLYYKTHPDEVERLYVGEIRERERVAKKMGDSALAANLPVVAAGEKAPVTWIQAYELALAKKGSANPANVANMRSWYSLLSATANHAGPSALNAYVGEGGAPVHRPGPLFPTEAVVTLLGSLLGQLLEE